ncbi:MAG: hypothetical protein K6F07_00610, partial [Bacilli bacterium]|nr:hypothetical protein [Bacilli bacterium]
MLKNSFKKIASIAMLAALGLTGCSSEIQAKPTNYNDKLLTFSDNSEVYHNMVSLVQDAYRDGSLASDVLNEVLYQYAVSIFGRYNKVAKPYNLNDTTLKEVAKDIYNHTTSGVTDASALSAATKAFVESFKAYHTTDNDGNRLTTAEAKQQEFDRILAKWNTIEDRIAKALYDDATSGTYSKRGVFYEKKLLLNYYNNLDKVANPYKMSDTDMYEVVFTPDVEDVDVFGNYLHREYYQTKEAYDLTATADEDVNTATVRYVEDKVIPEIYRTLLIEQYLLDESYNSLGRSYARKINVLSLGVNSNAPDAARYLMKGFVEDAISTGQTIELEQFNEISSINVGIPDKLKAITGYEFGSTELNNVMSTLGYTYVAESATDAGDDYYKGTDYGDLMMEYRKITDDILTTDSSAESDFTGSYTYDKEVGLNIKINELANKDYTENDWYVKNGSSGSLPDEIKTRLFNIGVANALDDDDVEDRWDGTTYAVPDDESNYVAMINGKHYLKVASKQAGADPKDDILFNINNTFYVVQIEEATSASKLGKESTVYESAVKEEIINEVAKVVAKDESYKTLSTKHWLEECKLKYHDTVVYDYF